MRALVIGCGRVGSTVAKRLAADGWDVAVIDEREEALERLGERWTGRFIVGHGMDTRVLIDGGIEDADAAVVATDGDNTNLVIGQVAQRRDRYERLEDEFGYQVQQGDATELFVLERAGIARPPDIVVAVTGDDEDNIVICQMAREKYGVEKVIARVNDPRNEENF